MAKAGVRFSQKAYFEIGYDGENITLSSDINGTKTDYDIGGGGGIERKSLYVNPDTSQEMGSVSLFEESEIEGYDFLAFTLTTTSGAWEVEEWCEIAPLKVHSGQFIVSMPSGGNPYGRKIFRSSGVVKTSQNVYKLGDTIEDKSLCIVKSVDAVKIKEA